MNMKISRHRRKLSWGIIQIDYSVVHSSVDGLKSCQMQAISTRKQEMGYEGSSVTYCAKEILGFRTDATSSMLLVVCTSTNSVKDYNTRDGGKHCDVLMAQYYENMSLVHRWPPPAIHIQVGWYAVWEKSGIISILVEQRTLHRLKIRWNNLLAIKSDMSITRLHHSISLLDHMLKVKIDNVPTALVVIEHFSEILLPESRSVELPSNTTPVESVIANIAEISVALEFLVGMEIKGGHSCMGVRIIIIFRELWHEVLDNTLHLHMSSSESAQVSMRISQILILNEKQVSKFRFCHLAWVTELCTYGQMIKNQVQKVLVLMTYDDRESIVYCSLQQPCYLMVQHMKENTSTSISRYHGTLVVNMKQQDEAWDLGASFASHVGSQVSSKVSAELIISVKMCGKYKATCAFLGALYSGIQLALEKYRMKEDGVNGAVTSSTAGATVLSRFEQITQTATLAFASSAWGQAEFQGEENVTDWARAGLVTGTAKEQEKLQKELPSSRRRHRTRTRDHGLLLPRA